MDDPDLGIVEALCVLQLAARRLGCTVRVCDANDHVRELIALAGLDDVLIDPPTRDWSGDAGSACRPASGDFQADAHEGNDL